MGCAGTKAKAEFWHIPPPDDLYLIMEGGDILPRVIGEHGPRPITNPELMRWTLFRIWLHRMETGG